MRHHLPLLVALFGMATIALGLALVYLPAGVVAAGIGLVLAGLFVIDDGRPNGGA